MKKFLCIFLSIALTLAFVLSANAAVRYGDVTGDNKVNSSDALLVLMAKVGLKTLNADQKKAADVDGNGTINSSDALLILNYSVGIVKTFPIEKKTTEPTTQGGGSMKENDPQMGHDTY